MYLDGYSKLALGTDLGVYVLEIGSSSKPAVRVIQLERISQIDILEDFRLLLVLAGTLICLNNKYLTNFKESSSNIIINYLYRQKSLFISA